MMTDEDAALTTLLAAVDEAGWAEADELIARLADDGDALYEWRGGERTSTGSIQMPWVEYGPTARATVAWLNRFHLVTPLFDWPSWYRRDRFPDAASIDAASAPDAVRLATSIVAVTDSTNAPSPPRSTTAA